LLVVSTHSRPKAAGVLASQFLSKGRFNTQPPEGGCWRRALLPAGL